MSPYIILSMRCYAICYLHPNTAAGCAFLSRPAMFLGEIEFIGSYHSQIKCSPYVSRHAGCSVTHLVIFRVDQLYFLKFLTHCSISALQKLSESIRTR